MSLSLIVAIAKNQVIGIENKLPWYLPEDLQFFKNTTLGHPIIMGRKTWQSIGKPLPNRLNIVLTQNKLWAPYSKLHEPISYFTLNNPVPSKNSGVALANHLETVLSHFSPEEKLFLIGGASLYTYALEKDLINELIITEIHQTVEGDTFFPNWNKEQFIETTRVHNPKTESRPFSFDFVHYLRKT